MTKTELARAAAEGVKTEYWRKPVPTDQFDWIACIYGLEMDGPTGYGATEEAAISNLMAQIDEPEPEQIT